MKHTAFYNISANALGFAKLGYLELRRPAGQAKSNEILYKNESQVAPLRA